MTQYVQQDLFGNSDELSREELRAAIEAEVREIIQPGWFDTPSTFTWEVNRRLAGIEHTMALVADLPDQPCQRCGTLSPHWLCEPCHAAQPGPAPW
jgi:hypothetical protein